MASRHKLPLSRYLRFAFGRVSRSPCVFNNFLASCFTKRLSSLCIFRPQNSILASIHADSAQMANVQFATFRDPRGGRPPIDVIGYQGVGVSAGILTRDRMGCIRFHDVLPLPSLRTHTDSWPIIEPSITHPVCHACFARLREREKARKKGVMVFHIVRSAA